MARKLKKVPVSERALIQRINRRIGGVSDGSWWGERLRKNSNPRYFSDLGWYYTVDIGRNVVRDRITDLEAYGRDVDALADHEQLWDENPTE